MSKSVESRVWLLSSPDRINKLYFRIAVNNKCKDEVCLGSMTSIEYVVERSR
jgi:hypothetical protein